MVDKQKREAEWAEAKTRCRLSEDEARMAREMGLNPLSLIKNIPSPQEPWKAPIRDWVREMYEKRQAKAAQKAKRKAPARPPDAPPAAEEPPPGPETADLPPLADEESIDLHAVFEAEPTHADWLEDVRTELSLGLHEEADVEPRADEAPEPAPSPPPRPRGRRRPAPEAAGRADSGLRRHQSYRLAAEYVAQAFADVPVVQKVALFGTLAAPAEEQGGKPATDRQAAGGNGPEPRHIGLAVWLAEPVHLKVLQRARNRGLARLAQDHRIGVAHHQVDVFLMEAGTDRQLGHLCDFSQCPKGKPECRVPGCGKTPFLQKLADSAFDPAVLEPERSVVLFERGSTAAADAGAPAQADPSDGSGPSDEPDGADPADEPVPF